ncbi:MAG TPA: DNA gyrase inhibitor YacG [Bryobacteraceae bacterium]|jgi:hypothetical protein|nr:DNA gyrase inhibitor YacG [Bryobacteraceae bacterium]
MAARAIHCPICKKEVSFNDPNMPFCSDRCRMIDLANWAEDKYVIPGGAPNKKGEDDVEEIEEEPEGLDL